MKRLKTGMRVHVDATKGKVTILTEESWKFCILHWLLIMYTLNSSSVQYGSYCFNSWFIIFCQLSLDYVQGKVSLWYDKEKFISQCLLVHTKTGSYIKHTSWLFDSDFLYPFFAMPCSTRFRSIVNTCDHAGKNWDWLAIAEAMELRLSLQVLVIPVGDATLC